MQMMYEVLREFIVCMWRGIFEGSAHDSIRFNFEKIERAKLFDIFGKFIRIVCLVSASYDIWHLRTHYERNAPKYLASKRLAFRSRDAYDFLLILSHDSILIFTKNHALYNLKYYMLYLNESKMKKIEIKIKERFCWSI